MLIKYYSGTTVEHEMLGNVLRSFYGDDSKVRDLLCMFVMNSLLGDYSGVMNRQQSMIYRFQTTPLPDSQSHNLTFDQCCLRRAEEIWQQCQDRPVIVFWSGGIDSTALLTALIATNDDWQKKLVIYTSHYAVEHEYPWFWDKYLKKLPVCFLVNQDFNQAEIYQQDALILTGYCADQLWGNSILKQFDHNGLVHWREFFQQPWFIQKTPAHLKTLVISYIEQQVNLFPRPINTMIDLAWMLVFVHTWDHVCRRPMARIPSLDLLDKLTHFYNTQDFQIWAMNNPQARVWREYRENKQVAKDFIYRLTKDNHYRIHKCKEQSMTYCCDDESLRSYWRLITDHGARSRLDPADHIAGRSEEHTSELQSH